MKTQNRQSIRLPEWDYRSQGAYFITIVTAGRLSSLGRIVDGQMRPSQYGQIVQEEWDRSAEIRCEIELDAFVLMPNHIHGVVWLTETSGHRTAPTSREEYPRERRAPRSLGSFVAGFKSAVTKRVRSLGLEPDMPVWQRNYYERVIRNERELQAIREYVRNNPVNWSRDSDNPDNA